MAFFEWQPEFSVSVAEIDQQHQRLIGLVNQLHEAIEKSNQLATMQSVLSEMDAITSTINEMIDYTIYHFSTEEKYMLEYKYPQYQQHKGEHQLFIDKVQNFKRNFENTKTRLSLDIADFIMNWWQEHILKTDKKCGIFLHQNGLS
ncbi:MAG: hemerythrin family protein [Planctomycetota bacterium]|nr:MAG: hemerythrin family protein [Planctomycetota bacterium]